MRPYADINGDFHCPDAAPSSNMTRLTLCARDAVKAAAGKKRKKNSLSLMLMNTAAIFEPNHKPTPENEYMRNITTNNPPRALYGDGGDHHQRGL